MRDFKKVEAWRRGHALAVALHGATRHFSRRGFGNLRSQLIRAAEAIAANIAEGCGAATRKELARFLDISIKSANETEHHLISARAHNLIDADRCRWFSSETIEVRKMTYSYRKKVLQDDDERPRDS
jgi:four helix bundle protein